MSFLENVLESLKKYKNEPTKAYRMTRLLAKNFDYALNEQKAFFLNKIKKISTKETENRLKIDSITEKIEIIENTYNNNDEIEIDGRFYYEKVSKKKEEVENRIKSIFESPLNSVVYKYGEDRSLLESINVIDSNKKSSVNSVLGKIFYKAICKNDLESVSQIYQYLEINEKFNMSWCKYNGLTPLLVSIKENSNQITEFLVEKGANINYKDINGKSAIHIAIQNNNNQIAEFLVEKGANINDKDINGKSAIHIAIQNNNNQIAAFLVEKGANISYEEKKESSETVQKLIRSKINANLSKMPKEYENNLISAIKNGNLQNTMFLVEKCAADIEQEENGKSALHIACENGKLSIIEYLVGQRHVCFNNYDIKSANKQKVKDYLNKMSLLHEAAKNEDLKKVKHLIEEENYFVDQIINGKAALHISCEVGNEKIIKYLIENCYCNVDIKTKGIYGGNTALHFACKRGNFSIVKYLMEECHCDIKARNNEGKTLLHIACEKENLLLVKYLVEKWKFNVETLTEDAYKERKNALHIASEGDNLEIVQYLIENCKANTKVKTEGTNGGKTALVIAKESGNSKIFKYLTENYNKTFRK